MRTRTFVLSFLVHAGVIGAAMVVRMFATTELPVPPQQTTFIVATPEVPQVEPPPSPAVDQSQAPTVNRIAAPVVEPDSLEPGLPDIPDRVATGPGVIVGAAGDVPVDVFASGPPPPPLRRPVEPPPPVRPGGVVRAPQKVHHVVPEYPKIARDARVSGVVIVEALIAEDGSVRDVKVLKSVPLLDAAAITAVRQWRFTPTLLNGVPVQVIMSVTVSFALN